MNSECVISSTSSYVPNGYLKETQNGQKIFDRFNNNASPQFPDDLSSTSKEHKGRIRRFSPNEVNSKPFKCSHCNKSFANHSYLCQHQRIHLGIRPYQCPFCERQFTQLSHQQQHMRTHTGEKPFKCTVCDKSFAQMSNLQCHSRVHQKDKPYRCNSCHKCFSEQRELLEHIPKHSLSKRRKIHICQVCGKSYSNFLYLSKHVRKHADDVATSVPAASTDTPAFYNDWPSISVSPQSAQNDLVTSEAGRNQYGPDPISASPTSSVSSTGSSYSHGTPNSPSAPADMVPHSVPASVFSLVHQSTGIENHHYNHFNNYQFPSMAAGQGYFPFNSPIPVPNSKFMIPANQLGGMDYRVPYYRPFERCLQEQN